MTARSANHRPDAERQKSGPKPRPVAERFWAKVERGDGCWLWRGARMPHGYGILGGPRRGPGGNPIPLKAHRVSWELHYGPVPDGLLVLHRCDNPPCVNPEHLCVGTQTDNMRDCANKGRIRGAVVRGAK